MAKPAVSEWIPWPSKFTPGHIAECEAAHALDVAAEWLGEIGVELPACLGLLALLRVPLFFAETRKGWRYRYPACVLTVEVESDADYDGERMVDRSRCVRAEVSRA